MEWRIRGVSGEPQSPTIFLEAHAEHEQGHPADQGIWGNTVSKEINHLHTRGRVAGVLAHIQRAKGRPKTHVEVHGLASPDVSNGGLFLSWDHGVHVNN